MRTPLTAVAGLSEELASGQSIELSSIVEDLLVAARADTGTLPVHISAVDVAEELQAVVRQPAHLTKYRSKDQVPPHGPIRSGSARFFVT